MFVANDYPTAWVHIWQVLNLYMLLLVESVRGGTHGSYTCLGEKVTTCLGEKVTGLLTIEFQMYTPCLWFNCNQDPVIVLTFGNQHCIHLPNSTLLESSFKEYILWFLQTCNKIHLICKLL